MVSPGYSENVYRGKSALVYWLPSALVAIGSFTMPAFFVVMGLGYLPTTDGAPVNRTFFLGMAPVELVACLFCAWLLWFVQRHHARQVSWDSQGVTVTWYRDQPRSFAWSDLQGARLRKLSSQSGVRTDVVTVETSTGRPFALSSGSSGYKELLAALAEHGLEPIEK